MFAVPENTIAPLPADVLSRHPVRTAMEFAADRGRWRSLLRYDPDERFAVLVDTVVSGELVETVHRDGSPGVMAETHVVRAGSSRVFGPGYVHRVRNVGPDPAVSVHVYQDGDRTVRPVRWSDACPKAVTATDA